jgi:hypothetical protein
MSTMSVFTMPAITPAVKQWLPMKLPMALRVSIDVTADSRLCAKWMAWRSSWVSLGLDTHRGVAVELWVLAKVPASHNPGLERLPRGPLPMFAIL